MRVLHTTVEITGVIYYMSVTAIQVEPLLQRAQDLRRRTEIISGKHSDTRIKPLTLANGHGHGRYIDVTPERALASVG
jgi:hypothetical protein